MTARGPSAWVALLRGVNVGGHRKVPMAELRDALASLGLEDVRTYIQSGNAVFRAGRQGRTELTSRIEDALDRTFGFPVSVMLRSAEEMDRVVEHGPFLGEGADPSRLHVAFLASAPSGKVAEDFASFRIGSDELRLAGSEAYLHCPEGMARSKLTPAFLERAMGTPSTVRNWRTTVALREMARGS